MTERYLVKIVVGRYGGHYYKYNGHGHTSKISKAYAYSREQLSRCHRSTIERGTVVLIPVSDLPRFNKEKNK